MAWVPGAAFTMGSDQHEPEERPARRVQVDGLYVDVHQVTNRAFAAFVAATGHQTTAERAPAAIDHPEVPPERLVAGSAVFTMPDGSVDLADPSRWWSYLPDASWHRPGGPGSAIDDRLDHPVVHVSMVDAEAYAAWAGKALPTEAEWERAARGGVDTPYPWGDERAPGGALANVWEGRFPWDHQRPRPPGTEPVGSHPPNRYGLYDVVGNVWEWTTTPFGPPPSRAIKGGSYLCSVDYCARDRPSARLAMTPDSSACHLGFRCVRRP